MYVDTVEPVMVDSEEREIYENNHCLFTKNQKEREKRTSKDKDKGLCHRERN